MYNGDKYVNIRLFFIKIAKIKYITLDKIADKVCGNRYKHLIVDREINQRTKQVCHQNQDLATSWNQHWAIQLRLPLGKFCNHILRRKDHVFNTVLFFNILFFVNVNSQLRRYWNLTLTAPKRR
ncbi:MAG: hypothetical protein EAZ78_01240 [Oscillatoriales cyanobacterium]|nr:MAG: hypothetical protein EAZ78_01240 [Oscillatoriales cyanobacterium]TAF47211.1 MAG: hypothetical protein EAZ68_02300 [Oscillatoriales cyanobacterium]TAF71470.1 MAG: hypothetical protein EAZ59_00700 [Oscillatoriales cyanobacterium]